MSEVYFNAKNLPEPFRAVQLGQRQAAKSAALGFLEEVTFTVRYTPDGKIQANNIQAKQIKVNEE